MPKSNEHIVISLTENELKIAQVKGAKDSATVTNVMVRSITGVGESDLPKVVRAASKGFNVKTANISYVISPSMITTKNIEIPSVSADEIKSIVSLQAGRHTPFSREEIQIGYVNIGVYKDNYTKVLLVIANKNVLKKQLTIFEKAGLQVQKVVFAPEGVASFFSKELGLEAEPTPTGILDIGEHSSELVLTFHGLAIAARSIPVGRMKLEKEGDSARDQLIDELGKTIESYQSEDIDQLPASYVISSDDKIAQELQPLLTEKLGWAVEVVPYIGSVKADKGVTKRLEEEFGATSLLDVIGTAMLISRDSKESSGQVNLMPEDLLMQKSLEAQGRQNLKLAILGFLALTFLGGFLGLRIYFHSSFLTKLQDAYDQNRKEVIALENRASQTKLLQDYMENRMESLDVLNELYNNIPREMYLTSLFIDQNGSVSIQGISEIASLVYKLRTSLKESFLFKSVEVKSQTAKKDRGKDVTAFEITLMLKNAIIEEELVVETE